MSGRPSSTTRSTRLKSRLSYLALLVASGISAGLVGMAMTLFVDALLLVGAHDDPGPAHWLTVVGVPSAGGLLAGAGWWWLRRGGPVRTVDDALSGGRGLPLGRTLADAAFQLLAAGTGSSIGRENAPRQGAAALAAAFPRKDGHTDSVVRELLPIAAGAGLGAVYNVPLAGAIFAFSVMRITPTFRTVCSALAVSGLATVTAWPVVGHQTFYTLPDFSPSRGLVLAAVGWMVVVMPLAGGIGGAFAAGADWAGRNRTPPRWYLPLSVGAAGAAVGACALVLPPVPGNGFDIIQLTLHLGGSGALFACLLVAKPVLTVLCLRCGAVGGTLTPALATGASLGGAAAFFFHWAGLPWMDSEYSIITCALIGAAAVLAVTQRAPLFAAVITWELTAAPLWLVGPIVVSALGSFYLARGARRAAAARKTPTGTAAATAP
ncbi:MULTISPECIES: chloride channel protein [unclassified Corynebacterium]|uniref:chloride channel protein n=1 Tax=unclassified Corynebacterium TaxID=2624378 RepID=UPI0034CD263B